MQGLDDPVLGVLALAPLFEVVHVQRPVEHDRNVRWPWQSLAWRHRLARAGLSEAAFEAAWAEGRALSPEQAIEYALLGEEREPPSPPPTPVPVAEQPPAAEEERRGGLTRREWEIALLVGRGHTNRRIAGELSISERTVHNHVRNALKKLGFRSRARLAAWVSER